MMGVALAGGASLRFGGQPKGLALLDGTPMVMHVHRVLSAVCSQVFIEALPDAGYEELVVECLYAARGDAGKGPLAGIAAGLAKAAHDEMVAFAPCDMPLLSAGVYEWLQAASDGGYVVTDAGVEPLVCVLPSRLLPDVRAALSSRQVPGVWSFLENSCARPVKFDDANLFRNVNTVEDLAWVSAQLRS